MTEAETVQAWKDSAIENLETAEDLLKLGGKLFNKYLEAHK